MQLTALRPELFEAFMRFVDEVRSAEADFASLATLRAEDLPSYRERLDGMRDGTVVTKAGVPLSTFFFVDVDGEILAACGLRHRLTPDLREYGGHIGFAVRPTARRRGVATALLSQLLEHTRGGGLGRAMLTCDETNLASQRVIERCGGKLDATYEYGPLRVPVRRYWIELGGESEEYSPRPITALRAVAGLPVG